MSADANRPIELRIPVHCRGCGDQIGYYAARLREDVHGDVHIVGVGDDPSFTKCACPHGTKARYDALCRCDKCVTFMALRARNRAEGRIP